MFYPVVFYRCLLCVTEKKDDQVIYDDSETDEDEQPKDEPCDENETKTSKTKEECENKDTNKENKKTKTKKDQVDTRDEETKSPEGEANKKSKDKSNTTEKKGIHPSRSFYFLLPPHI